jgi:hypothetical protein
MRHVLFGQIDSQFRLTRCDVHVNCDAHSLSFPSCHLDGAVNGAFYARIVPQVVPRNRALLHTQTHELVAPRALE